jgi:high affinity sulfate transporter 1
VNVDTVKLAPSLRGYDRSWLGKDVVGGLSAGAVVVPQAMAYATIAGLPVQVGLYTCMVPMVVYALLGGSRTLSVSTTSTIAVLTASSLLAAGVAAGASDPSRALATLTLLVGVILLLARVLRAGALIDNISEATLTGVKVGVGLTVAAGQLPGLLGVAEDADADNFFSEMRNVLDQLGDMSLVTVAFSVGTITTLLALRRYAPRVPAPLVAVVGGILLVQVAKLDEHGLALIAPVPSGLPTPVAPDVDHWRELLPGAFAIAIMCFLETAAVARSVRRRDEPPIDNDQELVASGFACTLGAFFRAMPSAGGFSQTAINQSAGARTQLSEIVTALLAVACALFLGGVLSDLPHATLGCLVVVAVVGLIDLRAFGEFWRLNHIEFWVAVAVAACGLVLGLLAAVFAGVILTFVLVLIELDRVGVTELQPTPDGTDVTVAGPDTVAVPGLLAMRVQGPLYTANVRSVCRKLLAAVDEHPGTDTLLVDGTAVGQLGVTIVNQVEELERELGDRGVALWFASLAPKALETARRLPRWTELAEARRVHPTTAAAVRAYRAQPSTGAAG